jgi:hypothetical protein
MREKLRHGFSLSLPKIVVAALDSERGVATRSAYLTNILANLYNIRIQPYPGRKVSSQAPDIASVSTPVKGEYNVS